MARDWRDGDRALSMRIGILERRSESAMSRALVRLLWMAVADGEACSCMADRCPLCEAWAALGFGPKWPGAKDAERAMSRTKP